MATKPTTEVKAWSFSRYSDYKKCPLSFKIKHLDKIAEPPNAAMARGAAIHTQAENYLKGTLARLPAELKLFADEFKELRKLYKKRTAGMIVEDNWAFTNAWEPTMWNDWVNCWVRIKLDCAHVVDDTTMLVKDWKTGKFRADKNEEYVEQLELYALAALLLHPHIERVIPMLKYVDLGVTYPAEGSEIVYTRADIPKLKKAWAARVKAMFNDKRFAPRPNNLCGFCFYGKAGLGLDKDGKPKGGPGLCKF